MMSQVHKIVLGCEMNPNQVQDTGKNYLCWMNETIRLQYSWWMTFDVQHHGQQVSGVCLNVPIQQEQQDESRQVGFWNVWLLLETDEDQHHHGGWDDVVQLPRWQHQTLEKH